MKLLLRTLLLACIIYWVPEPAYAQEKGLVEVSVKVTDQSGTPIPMARIYSESSNFTATTNEDGKFFVQTTEDDVLFIEADGFKSTTMNAGSVQGIERSIRLTVLPYGLRESDDVRVPFGTLKKRQLTGPAYTIRADELLNYDKRQSVTAVLNTRVPGLFGNLNNRGIGSAITIVDGVPRPANDINLQEVDEITYLADAGTRMLYGTQANNGVILITTKRGHPYKKKITVSAEQGIDVPVSYPDFLNAYDYARLYNEASVNDGLEPFYDSAALNGFQNQANPLLYPDESYFNDRYLRNFRPFSNVITEFSGGNEQAQYYMNLGWTSTGNILTVGEGANERSDRFNIRGNVDFQVTDQISMNLDVVGVFDREHGPNNNFWSNAATFHPDWYPVLIDTNDVYIPNPDEITNTVADGKLLGGTSQYQSNIYGDLVFDGYTDRLDRFGQFNTGLDFDLDELVRGLTAHAYLSFDIYNFFRTTQDNDYAVYEAESYNEDTVTVDKIGVDNFTGSQNIRGVTFYRNFGYFGTLKYARSFNNEHVIDATAVAYSDRFINEGEIHPSMHLHFGLRANYMYRNKYVLQVSTALPGSSKLPPGDKFGLSHSIGLGWVLTGEDFLAASSLIDYLKLKASHSIMNTEEGLNDYYMYDISYSRGATFTYDDGSHENRILTIGNLANPLLSYARRRDVNMGIEAMLMDYRLSVTANYFYSNSYDEVTAISNQFPAYLGNINIYENYESFLDQGADFSLNYKSSFSDLHIDLGITGVYSVPKVVRIDEPNYEYDYRKREGKPSDAIFGWVDEGFYSEDDFNDDGSLLEEIPNPTFGKVQPGDIKYRDLNDDGIIDENDQEVIGNNSARMQLGLNIHLVYKNFEFFSQAIYQGGADNIYDSEYYWIYGDRKYSEVALGRWTPETAASATYPRLSRGDNSNNFRRSTFWLVDDDYFTLRAVQFTYRLPDAWMASMPTSSIRIYARGQNLLTLSPSKEKRQLNVGSSPQFRNYSVGLTLTF